MTITRKHIVRTLIVIGIILAIMLTMHVLINNLDLPGVLRSMHGG